MANHTDFEINGFIIPKDNTVIAEQTHSANVHVCTKSDSGAGFDSHPQIMNCDALISNIHHQFLLIRTADCTPILCYDKKTHSIGAAHSGREGTRKNIAGNLIKAMQAAYCAKPEDIRVRIGAGICKLHYQVSEVIGLEFAQSCKQNGIKIDESDIMHIDIQNVIIQQLEQAGIVPDNIEKNEMCTYESPIHFSYRKDGSLNRQINIIGFIDG